MRRHVGGHSNGNTRSSIDQERRNPGWHNRRLLSGVVVVQLKINGFLVNVPHEFLGDFAHAHLGIPHCRGGIAVHGAKVSLAVHKHVAKAPFLGHAHNGIINCGVAVGVVLTHHLTNN